MPVKLGIIVAMDKEFAQLRHLLSDAREEQRGAFCFYRGRVGSKSVVLMQCGMGKVNAACGATELIRTYQPEAVVSTGVAGGIDAALRVMDVVVSREVVFHDVWCGEGNAYGQVQGLPERFTADTRLLAVAEGLSASLPEVRVVPGLICTGDQFITDRRELQAIKDKFPEGIAVDMESGAIAQTCHLHGVPFISFRVISDTPGIDNHLSQYNDFWDTVVQRSFAAIHRFIQDI